MLAQIRTDFPKDMQLSGEKADAQLPTPLVLAISEKIQVKSLDGRQSMVPTNPTYLLT